MREDAEAQHRVTTSRRAAARLGGKDLAVGRRRGGSRVPRIPPVSLGVCCNWPESLTSEKGKCERTTLTFLAVRDRSRTRTRPAEFTRVHENAKILPIFRAFYSAVFGVSRFANSTGLTRPGGKSGLRGAVLGEGVGDWTSATGTRTGSGG